MSGTLLLRFVAPGGVRCFVLDRSLAGVPARTPALVEGLGLLIADACIALASGPSENASAARSPPSGRCTGIRARDLC